MWWVLSHLALPLNSIGYAQREERWEYPLEALRELVVNMIVHRNYMNSNDSVIKFFDDRIEFFNPGKLPNGLTVEQLIRGDYFSAIRNKQIASVFKDACIIEKYGSGIKRVLYAFSKYNLPQLVFTPIVLQPLEPTFWTEHWKSIPQGELRTRLAEVPKDKRGLY